MTSYIQSKPPDFFNGVLRATTLLSPLSKKDSYDRPPTPGTKAAELAASAHPPSLTASLKPKFTSAISAQGLKIPALPAAGTDTLRFILLCLLWYGSSAITNNIGKQILNQFKYPVTLTYAQFGFVALYCYLFSWVSGSRIRVATRDIVLTVLPLSAFQIVGHVFSSVAISQVHVSFVHCIKALSPLFTVLLYRFLFRVNYRRQVYISLLPLTFGVMMVLSLQAKGNAMGFLCALGSCLVFVTQNIFSKKLLFKEQSKEKKRLDKLNLLFYSSFMAFVLMMPLWFYSEGKHLIALWLRHTTHVSITHNSPTSSGGLSILFGFILNGISHFAQNVVAFNLLSLTSPVTYSIASLVKRIFVIVASIIWFGQVVSFTQACGILLTFVGLWMYQSAKVNVEREEVRVRSKESEVLPMTNKSFTE
ncbi:uncharacterized protein VTP21DRAFT_8070 [Calcarisporiella thermophila]|uniref:uncharacterized protein n=1 Tax=Calcarisporiella thermophila TaxID=911321 RepID=UPI00374288DC